MKKTFVLMCGLTLSSLVNIHGQQSAYVPLPKQFVITPSFVYQSYNDFWLGTKSTSLKPNDVKQYSGFMTAEYGVMPKIALDATLGYTTVESKAFGKPHSRDGLADTTLGVRYQFLDETKVSYPFAPTAALRLGGIIKGSYDDDFPSSPGNGASGFDISMPLGKQLGTSGFAIVGDIGGRIFPNDVPNYIYGSAGLQQTLMNCVTISADYTYSGACSGSDIGDPGFTFPHTKQVAHTVGGSIGFTDKGGRYYQVYGGATVDGRNVGQQSIIGCSVSLPFGH